jgi:ribosomal protein L12E/L44/L45/RPP1/RPP2
MDSAAKLAKLKAIFKAKDQVMATLGGGDMAETTTTESVEGAADDEEVEEEEEETMKESVRKQIGNLQEENRQLKAKLELEQGKIVCKKLLESAGCEATDVRINALLRTPEKERKALLESFASKPARQRPASSPSALLESSGRGAVEYPKDIKDFKSVLR